MAESGRGAPGDGERHGRDVGREAANAVVEVLEEWRIHDEWWRVPINRRYAEVVLTDGAHIVLFEDLATGAWYAQTP